MNSNDPDPGGQLTTDLLVLDLDPEYWYWYLLKMFLDTKKYGTPSFSTKN